MKDETTFGIFLTGSTDAAIPVVRAAGFSVVVAVLATLIVGVGPASAQTKVAPVLCMDCGVVESVRSADAGGEAGGLGLGTGTLGGAPGIGSGSGLFNNPAGTQGRAGSTTGATGAPNAGNQPAAAGGTSIYGTPRADPTRTQGRTRVEIAVKMDDGRAQMVTAVNDAGLKTGDRVRVIDGKLMRIP